MKLKGIIEEIIFQNEENNEAAYIYYRESY